jgi:hypothetical protein
VRKFLIFCSLWLGLAAGVDAAENFVLASGASFSGDIVKFDDHEAMIHTTTDTYTNVAWPDFSQDTLKQLSGNPKYRPLAVWFIQPTPAAKPAQHRVAVHEVKRMALPEHPSILGGIMHSSLGLFMVLIVYLANLYAAYEVAVVRGKPLASVMGLSAVLPVAGQVIFLLQPVQSHTAEEAPVEAPAAEGVAGSPAAGSAPGGAAAANAAAGGAAPAGAATDDLQIMSASWQPSHEEQKPQPQVFARGKFTLNKRFIETKFANYIGELKGEGKNFTMEIRTLKEVIAVECIKQVGQTEAIVETPKGQLTVPFADILEIKLIPKPA